jgi:hypothetical protein
VHPVTGTGISDAVHPVRRPTAPEAAGSKRVERSVPGASARPTVAILPPCRDACAPPQLTRYWAVARGRAASPLPRGPRGPRSPPALCDKFARVWELATLPWPCRATAAHLKCTIPFITFLCAEGALLRAEITRSLSLPVISDLQQKEKEKNRANALQLRRCAYCYAMTPRGRAAPILNRCQRDVLRCDDAAKASSDGRVKRLAEEEQLSVGTRQMPAR